MRAEIQSPRPDAAKPDPYKLSIESQMAILERLADDKERLAWAEKHAATFRKLFESDGSFRRLAQEMDVEGMLERIEEAERGPLA